MPEVPGFFTRTGTVPAFMMAEAGIMAVSFVLPEKVVVSFVPLKMMIAFEAKFVPSTSNENDAPPCEAVEGFNAEIAGVAGGVVVMEGLE